MLFVLACLYKNCEQEGQGLKGSFAEHDFCPGMLGVWVLARVYGNGKNGQGCK